METSALEKSENLLQKTQKFCRNFWGEISEFGNVKMSREK